MNKKMLLAVPLLAALPLTACGHKHAAAEAPVSASAHAFATSSQGRYDKAQAEALVRKCFPASETAQTRMLAPSKGKPARVAAENCLKIPSQNRIAFDDALLNALLHGHVKSKAGRTTLIEVTIPQLIVKYQ